MKEEESDLCDNSKIIIQAIVKILVHKNLLFDDEKILATFRPITLNYYNQCHAEMAAMKNQKFEGTFVAYYAFSNESVDVLARYVRNDQIVKEFETKLYETLFPIYGTELKKSFDKAVARQKLIEKVSIILSEILQFAGPDHVAFEIIFQCLSKEDIDLIVSSA